MSIISAADAQSLKGAIFIDTRPQATWAGETISGAAQLAAYDYFISTSTEDGIKRMVSGLKAAFAALGLDGTRPVIFFEEATGMISPRALWFYELCGYTNGMILDGGIKAWKAIGGATQPGVGQAMKISDGPAEGAGNFTEALICDLSSARAAGQDLPPSLVDTRDPPEWLGDFAHGCCARQGRLPGSIHLFYEDVLHEGHYIAPAQIAAKAAAAGLSPDQHVIAYCHRGARAATVFYALKAAGYSDLTIYTGGWHEWSNLPELPIITRG